MIKGSIKKKLYIITKFVSGVMMGMFSVAWILNMLHQDWWQAIESGIGFCFMLYYNHEANCNINEMENKELIDELLHEPDDQHNQS